MFHFIHLALPLHHRYYIAPKLGITSPQFYKLVEMARRDRRPYFTNHIFYALSYEVASFPKKVWNKTRNFKIKTTLPFHAQLLQSVKRATVRFKKTCRLALARYVFSKPPLLFIFLLLHTVLPTPPGARAAINNAAAGAATGGDRACVALASQRPAVQPFE